MSSAKTTIKRLVPKKLRDQLLPTYHLFEAMFWSALAGFPQRNLKVIGITGTNGKTSTTFMVHRMLCEVGYSAGLMTTVAYGVGSSITAQPGHATNVPIREFLRRLKQMKAEGMDWLVLETTSHALAQHRVWGVPFSAAVLTNITHEHLEYHGTFENYRRAKLRLFERVGRNTRGLGVGIINYDDPTADLFASVVPKPVRYGIEGGDLQATNIQMNSSGIAYDVSLGGILTHITTSIPGSFTVYNTLAAVGVGQALGLTPPQIAAGIAALKGVEGRMTSIEAGQGFSVLVDFAHTPDSFEKLFKDLRPVVKGKLIVMFGSAGRRDTAKRPVQGKLAGKYADIVVLTEEDDRDEDGNGILAAIAGGAEQAGKVQGSDLHLILDRTEAIKFALAQATSPDDTVLLLGKGHEKTIERAGGEDPWDEPAIARKYLLRKMKN